MKLMKAVKKLKFWSSKKNKTKKRHNLYGTYQYLQPPYSPTPPPPPLPRMQLEPPAHHCNCHFCHPIEPSAPPLPPWLESQFSSQIQESISGPNWADPFHGPPHSDQNGDQPISTQQQSKEGSSSSSAYQQYLAENPVYDISIVPNRPKKVAAKGLFGCSVSFGSFIFRCFCPCFHISEPLKDEYYRVGVRTKGRN